MIDKLYCLAIVRQNTKDGQSALFHVVMKGQERVDLVEKMLEQGANPNIQDAVSGYTRYCWVPIS